MLYASEPACWLLYSTRPTALYSMLSKASGSLSGVHIQLVTNVICYSHYWLCTILYMLFASSPTFWGLHSTGHKWTIDAICTMLYATCFTLLGSTFKLSQMYYVICLILHSQLIGPTLDPHPTSALNCRIRLSLTGSKKYVKMKVLKKTLSGPFWGQ